MSMNNPTLMPPLSTGEMNQEPTIVPVKREMLITIQSWNDFTAITQFAPVQSLRAACHQAEADRRSNNAVRSGNW